MKNEKKSTKRYLLLFALVSLISCYIIGIAASMMVGKKRDYWIEVNRRFTRENIPIPSMRGNILSADGHLLAGSLPQYKLFLDFVIIDKDSAARNKAQAWRDSTFATNLDSIASGLAKIFPDKNKKWFKENLLKGKTQSDQWLKAKQTGEKSKGGHVLRVYPRNATYIQYMECKKLPLFRESSIKGGFYAEEVTQREKPYGSLASRTIGELYGDTDKPKCGIEISYDSILRGTPGVGHSKKVRNRRVRFVDRGPENGHDLITTIDVEIQDAAETALRKKLMELDGVEFGVAIVMEVATGDVKAIVNLSRGRNGQFGENENHALGTRMEPGSTFKTASIMVGLEDGVIKKSQSVDCAGGKYAMHGRIMKDHNAHKGGYGVLSVSQILEQSSNIGVSRLIDRAYHEKPQSYVDGLYKLGVGAPLNLHFIGERDPIVSQPNSKVRYWSNTDLAWMSIGYVTQLTPMHTLAFYNGIANNGRMVKPRFIKAEVEDGIVVKEYPTEVIREQMCSQHTLDDIHDILEKVVSRGLGKRAGNGGKLFPVSGKTGTAQIAAADGRGYHSGPRRYMVSFCGYYPSDAPKYSTIVCIVKSGTASGGVMCGPVFSEISKYVMSKGEARTLKEARDSTAVYTTTIAPGEMADAHQLAAYLNLDPNTIVSPASTEKDKMPSVLGMGAKTALFTLQQHGINATLSGSGRVVSQSVKSGEAIKKGQTIRLELK